MRILTICCLSAKYNFSHLALARFTSHLSPLTSLSIILSIIPQHHTHTNLLSGAGEGRGVLSYIPLDSRLLTLDSRLLTLDSRLSTFDSLVQSSMSLPFGSKNKLFSQNSCTIQIFLLPLHPLTKQERNKKHTI